MKLEYVDETAVLTLDHPPVNALGLEEVQQITTLVRSLRPGAPLVITGTGAAFCAGVDTKAFASYETTARVELVHAITEMVAELVAVPSPVVAGINGHALGGGFVVMLCADYRLAAGTSTIKFGLTEAQAGIPFPIGPMEVIRHELTPGLLRYLTLSSSMLDPAAALEANVIDELVHQAEAVESQAIERASQIKAQSGFAVVKQQVRGQLAARLRDLAESKNDPLTEWLTRAS